MKVLVVGGGGREHALAWKVKASPLVSEVLVAPGNAGTAEVGRNCPLPSDPGGAIPAVRELVRREGVSLVVVGPEAYLVAGLADALRADGVAVVGPGAQAARIEGSKSFAKDLMAEAGIPTAAYRVFTEARAALAHVHSLDPPIVVKADGLAAGKGVVVAQTWDEAEAAVTAALERGVFGEAGRKVVVEEFLAGREASVLALTDGEDCLLLPAAQDHKRAYDGDQGPNTGGMGAYAPTPAVTEEVAGQVREEILLPAIRALARAGCPFQGVLYAGLMLTKAGPKVVEFNARFGDPETQVILPLLQDDLVPYLQGAATPGGLAGLPALRSSGAAVTVVLAAKGYPGAYQKGLPLGGLDAAAALPGVLLFHAGTKRDETGQVVSSGGRVLNVTGVGASLAEARERAYAGVAAIRFPGGEWRRDIAVRLA
ncbi:MAG: phosphoribosylamine--glycine ligase [Bacillota bacterium]|nr:phosphoribosylamine--glycine ligase [Bacillota bacterium]